MSEDNNTKFNPIILGELTKYKFIIPYYQRGYRWSSENVELLLNDLYKFLNSEDQVYFMQPLAVTEVVKDKEYEVIDGQQRLTTFYILRKFLEKKLSIQITWYEFEYKKDVKKQDDNTFISILNDLKIIEKEDIKSIKNINKFYILNAYTTIAKWFENHETEIEKFKDLLTTTKDTAPNIKFLWYEVKTDDSHKVFQNINSNKIHLTNSDLIKALLLSKETGLENRYQIAAQFEEMERQFANGKFWYTFSNQDVRRDKGQSRIDLLFNFTQENIKDLKDPNYVNNSRITFYAMMKMDKNELLKTWKNVRTYFQILKDLYSNVIFYHYIGYLRYANQESFDLKKYVELYTEKNKIDFEKELKNDISRTLDFSDIDAYHYDIPKYKLRKLFLLHNIETIIQRYKVLKSRVDYYYEYFPFELLYKQNWNIEHIDSQTLGDLKTSQEKGMWLCSVLNDYKEYISKNVRILTNKDNLDFDNIADYLLSNEEEFNHFYKEIGRYIRNGIEDSLTEEDKNKIGNLVLLDEHINKSFHNSVFPTKRKIVLQACGLLKENKESHTEEKHPYVPICTKDIYTKAYNITDNVKLNCWTKKDAEEYKTDIKTKLKYFFETKESLENKGEDNE